MVNEGIKEIIDNGFFNMRYSCGNRRKGIVIGDRVFVMFLGKQVKDKLKGIFASGYVTSEIFQSDDESNFKHFVEVKFDVILNPYFHKILSHDFLKSNTPFSEYKFDRHCGGNIINDRIATDIEIVWTFLKFHSIFRN
jgi:hypothetical protein